MSLKGIWKKFKKDSAGGGQQEPPRRSYIMAENDNAHAIRLYNALLALGGAGAAEEIAEKHPLSKSAGRQREYIWAKNICSCLEERYSGKSLIAIRSRCYCEDGTAAANRMRGYLRQSGGNLEEFARMHNWKEKGPKVEVVKGGLLYIYPQCRCSCVKQAEGPISQTWCYCTLGHVKKLFSQAFGPHIEAELWETVKSGGKRCVIFVELKK